MPSSITSSAAPLPQPGGGERRWQAPLLAGTLSLLVAAVYANTLDVPFLFDDQAAIVRNQSIRQLWPLTNVLQPPLDAAGATGRPLVNLSLAINYALGGLDVRGYHIFNLLVHILATLTLWGVVKRTLAISRVAIPSGKMFSWIIALLWGVHPLLTESVTCIVQRNEVMVGLFYLLTFYGFTRSVGTTTGRNKQIWQGVAIASCLLGTATKEVMATAPLLVLLYDRAFAGGTFQNAWKQRRTFYLCLASSWILLAWLMLGSNQRAGTVGFGLGLSGWDYLVTQCRAIAVYIKLSFWPHPLIVDYGFVTFRLREVLPEALGIVSLLAATIWALVKRPAWGFLGAWFFAILAPSSSIVPLVTQTMAEHRMYLPLIALLIGTGAVFHRALRTRGGLLFLGVVTLLFGAMTWQRNEVYRDELRFWQDALEKQPDNERLHASLGYYYMRRGDWLKAITAYGKAIALQPNFADAQSDLGSILLEVGHDEDAIALHAEAARLKPTDPAILFNYAQALHKTGKNEEAMTQWREAIRLRPTLAPALRQLGKALAAQGKLDEAILMLENARSNDPADVEIYSALGDALFQKSDLSAASENYDRAITLRPDLAELHYNLGNIRLALNEFDRAVERYAEAVRLKPEFIQARHNLALALTRAGRASEALPHYEETLRQMPDSAQVHYNFGLALEQVGNPSLAIEHYQKALQLNPGYPSAKERLRRLQGN